MHKTQLRTAHSKLCANCGTGFQTVKKSQKYCSDKCQHTAASRRFRAKSTKAKEKRYGDKLEKTLSTGFYKWMRNECRRAGTVQILEGLTTETLLELYSLTKKRTRYSGYTEGKTAAVYELSHIVPVKGLQERIGLLNPKNLVIAPSRWNRRNVGKKLQSLNPAVGLSIPRSDLQAKYSITETTTDKQLLKKVETLLKDEWRGFVSEVAVTRNQTDTLKAKLKKQEIDFPVWASLDELKVLAASQDVGFFSLTLGPEAECLVLLAEIDRLGFHRPEHGIYRKWLSQIAEIETSPDIANWVSDLQGLTEALVNDCLEVLHGYPLPPRTEQVKGWLLELDEPPRQQPLYRSEDDHLLDWVVGLDEVSCLGIPEPSPYF